MAQTGYPKVGWETGWVWGDQGAVDLEQSPRGQHTAAKPRQGL